MQTAAANLEYERAALLRDQINELKNGTGLSKIEPKNRRPVSYRSGKTPKKGRAKHITERQRGDV
jgi:excinuclease ABC subunit B